MQRFIGWAPGRDGAATNLGTLQWDYAQGPMEALGGVRLLMSEVPLQGGACPYIPFYDYSLILEMPDPTRSSYPPRPQRLNPQQAAVTLRPGRDGGMEAGCV